MFQHLLVPLDGSTLAESALPAAAFLAVKLPAEVTLIHAIERHAPDTIHGTRHLKTAEEARIYLDDVARRAFSPGLSIHCHVHTNEVDDVARSLADHASEIADVLVVMCTHGRSGLRQLLVGSIAQQVVAVGTAPVLLIPPKEADHAHAFGCGRLLVPLDGREVHEQGLPPAETLARACHAEIRLTLVVPTPGTLAADAAATGRLLPRTTDALLAMAGEDAAAYLARHVACLEAGHFDVSTEVRRGEPVGAILAAAHEAAADIIVLATHRRKGIEAFWSGSVAARVVAQATMPVLLVPIRET